MGEGRRGREEEAEFGVSDHIEGSSHGLGSVIFKMIPVPQFENFMVIVACVEMAIRTVSAEMGLLQDRLRSHLKV